MSVHDVCGVAGLPRCVRGGGPLGSAGCEAGRALRRLRGSLAVSPTQLLQQRVRQALDLARVVHEERLARPHELRRGRKRKRAISMSANIPYQDIPYQDIPYQEAQARDQHRECGWWIRASWKLCGGR